MNNLSIDIIMPVYKAKKTIKKTLESIMYQINSEKFNIYLVNDCDNEDYSEIINIFKPYLNIKELKMAKNGGPGLARQHGVDNSNGEYIVFIDADDYFYGPEAIIKMYDKMKDIVYQSKNAFFNDVVRIGIEVLEKQEKDNWAIKNEKQTLLDAIHEHTKRMNYFIKFSKPFIQTAYADSEINQQILLHIFCMQQPDHQQQL